MPKKSRKRNSKFLEKNAGLIILAIVLLFLGWYGGTHDWYHVSLNGNSTGSTTNNIFTSGGSNAQGVPSTPTQQVGYYLNLAITPTVVCQGSLITATLSGNMPNAQCTAYGKYAPGDYSAMGNFVTGSNGAYSLAGVLNASSTWRILCQIGNSVQASNEVYVLVTSCPPTNPCPNGMTDCGGDCVDLEQDNKNCGSCYYSCPAGTVCDMGHCDSTNTCYDSDDTNVLTSGYCHDNLYPVDYVDNCASRTSVWEYSCGSDHLCRQGEIECPTDFECESGACVDKRLPCDSIINPVSQKTCDAGYCPSGELAKCTYIPATILNPARCGCFSRI